MLSVFFTLCVQIDLSSYSLHSCRPALLERVCPRYFAGHQRPFPSLASCPTEVPGLASLLTYVSHGSYLSLLFSWPNSYRVQAAFLYHWVAHAPLLTVCSLFILCTDLTWGHSSSSLFSVIYLCFSLHFVILAAFSYWKVFIVQINAHWKVGTLQHLISMQVVLWDKGSVLSMPLCNFGLL